MTEIMPFPENNILFYWAAPHGSFFMKENRCFHCYFLAGKQLSTLQTDASCVMIYARTI